VFVIPPLVIRTFAVGGKELLYPLVIIPLVDSGEKHLPAIYYGISLLFCAGVPICCYPFALLMESR